MLRSAALASMVEASTPMARPSPDPPRRSEPEPSRRSPCGPHGAARGCDSGMVRHTIPAFSRRNSRRQGIRAAPFQPALRVDALEVAHQVHAEIAPRRHRRRPQPGRVKDRQAASAKLSKPPSTVPTADGRKTMTRRARHLRPAYHQVPLTILLLSHRHQRIPRSNQNVKESDQAAVSSADFVNGLLGYKIRGSRNDKY